jgi:hypothetical protein
MGEGTQGDIVLKVRFLLEEGAVPAGHSNCSYVLHKTYRRD